MLIGTLVHCTCRGETTRYLGHLLLTDTARSRRAVARSTWCRGHMYNSNSAELGIRDALSSFDKPSIRHFEKHLRRPEYNNIPGDDGMPVLGHIYPFIYDFHNFVNKQYAKYGPVFKVRTPLQDLVMLLGPQANRLLYQNENRIFSNYLAWDVVFNGLFDNNVLLRDFDDHKIQRKVLQQTFKRQVMESHIEMMNPLIKKGISQWRTTRTTRMMYQIKRLLLNIGAKVFLGVEVGKETDRINKAFTDIVAGTADPFRLKQLWFTPYAKGLKGNRILTRFVKENIVSRRNSGGSDIFSQLCTVKNEEGNQLSDEEIRDHIIFVLFAAHDTTTSALSSILYALASNMQWQERLREEMFGLNTTALGFADLEAMKNTELTLKEALRMYPPLSTMPRFSLEEFEFNGIMIPKHSILGISPLFTHYMPEYWSNPYCFDPLRFSQERSEDKKDFYQYVPFGGGAHKCLGLHFAQIQTKMFLFYFLKEYRVSKRKTMRKYRIRNIPLTFPVDGLPLSLERIKTRR